jgi:hypothetical protein
VEGIIRLQRVKAIALARSGWLAISRRDARSARDP